MRYFEELEVGEETLFKGEYLATEEEIIETANRFDAQPFHTDPVAAEKSFFGGLVACSAHTFAMWSALGNNSEIDKDKLIGGAVSALGFNNLQWHNPVRPGDVLKRKQVILELRDSKSKPHLGIIRSADTVYNQNSETVFTLEIASLHEKTAST